MAFGTSEMLVKDILRISKIAAFQIDSRMHVTIAPTQCKHIICVCTYEQFTHQ
jgi:hypothetical protein